MVSKQNKEKEEMVRKILAEDSSASLSTLQARVKKRFGKGLCNGRLGKLRREILGEKSKTESKNKKSNVKPRTKASKEAKIQYAVDLFRKHPDWSDSKVRAAVAKKFKSILHSRYTKTIREHARGGEEPPQQEYSTQTLPLKKEDRYANACRIIARAYDSAANFGALAITFRLLATLMGVKKISGEDISYIGGYLHGSGYSASVQDDALVISSLSAEPIKATLEMFEE